MPPGKKRLLLADDHPEILHEIQQLVARDFEVVGTAADGATLVQMAKDLRPDVVVTDIRMPRVSGIDAARTILQQKTCEVIVVLTVYNDLRMVRNTLDAGVRGYVLKANAGEELIPAIKRTLGGGVFVSRHVGPPPGAKGV